MKPARAMHATDTWRIFRRSCLLRNSQPFIQINATLFRFCSEYPDCNQNIFPHFCPDEIQNFNTIPPSILHATTATTYLNVRWLVDREETIQRDRVSRMVQNHIKTEVDQGLSSIHPILPERFHPILGDFLTA